MENITIEKREMEPGHAVTIKREQQRSEKR